MKYRHLAGIVLICSLGLVSVGYAQTGGGFMGIPGTAFGEATDPSMVPIISGFRLIPSMMVGEGYDKNVLFQVSGNNGFLIERQVAQVSFTQAFY
jgi:hypothetical protein